MARFEPEQEKLLTLLVEAYRNVPSEKREPFRATRDNEGTSLHHPGLPGRTVPLNWEDLDTLARYGMVTVHSPGENMRSFTVSPDGFEHYSQMHGGEPAGQVEEETLSYLDSREFRESHPEAYDHLSRAAEGLRSGDTDQNCTEIGHHCRNALMAFADSLLSRYRSEGPTDDRTKTEGRLRAVVAPIRPTLGSKASDFLDALIAYWRAVSNLAMRQDHGANREDEEHTWEDARRLVFQTAVVMFEIDRALALYGERR